MVFKFFQLSFLKISQLNNAKISLKKGLIIEPSNYRAIFQLGNIYLMEENYSEAINLFDKSINFSLSQSLVNFNPRSPG